MRSDNLHETLRELLTTFDALPEDAKSSIRELFPSVANAYVSHEVRHLAGLPDPLIR
jgi:hypothetical protein